MFPSKSTVTYTSSFSTHSTSLGSLSLSHNLQWLSSLSVNLIIKKTFFLSLQSSLYQFSHCLIHPALPTKEESGTHLRTSLTSLIRQQIQLQLRTIQPLLFLFKPKAQRGESTQILIQCARTPIWFIPVETSDSLLFCITHTIHIIYRLKCQVISLLQFRNFRQSFYFYQSSKTVLDFKSYSFT